MNELDSLPRWKQLLVLKYNIFIDGIIILLGRELVRRGKEQKGRKDGSSSE